MTINSAPAAEREHSSPSRADTLAISIVICTWNRSDMLEDTIRAVMSCDRDDSMRVQLIVVDNASSDGTSALLDRLRVEFAFDRLYESRPGLSHARNTGIDAANGEWVIFLDDDVLLSRSFLLNYARAIRALPEAGFIAGGVVPHFDDPLPTWTRLLLEEEPWAFSAIDLQPPMRELHPVQFPFGANMAVRRALLEHTRFSEAYGYRHGIMIPGEETVLFEEIREAGHRGFWVPDVAVLHRLPSQRQSFAYLRKRALGQGRAEGMRSRQTAGSRLRVPRWLPAEVARLSFACVWSTLRADPHTRVKAILLSRRVGQLLEHLTG